MKKILISLMLILSIISVFKSFSTPSIKQEAKDPLEVLIEYLSENGNIVELDGKSKYTIRYDDYNDNIELEYILYDDYDQTKISISTTISLNNKSNYTNTSFLQILRPEGYGSVNVSAEGVIDKRVFSETNQKFDDVEINAPVSSVNSLVKISFGASIAKLLKWADNTLEDIDSSIGLYEFGFTNY